MEKNFAKLNYYEMLDLKPGASFFEVRHAYNTALQSYQADSLISYSFFSPEERAEILGLLEKAYLTLMNEKERQNYDDELIRLGIIPELVKRPIVKTPVSIFNINREESKTGTVRTAVSDLRAKIADNNLIGEILAQKEINGSDLQKIRNELAVKLENIAQETKIRLDYLTAIEEDNIQTLPAAVFLKGFVKAYLKCLCLEPADEICGRYINHHTTGPGAKE